MVHLTLAHKVSRIGKTGYTRKAWEADCSAGNVIEINSQLGVSQLLGIAFYVSNRFPLFLVMLMEKVSKVHGEDKMLE